MNNRGLKNRTAIANAVDTNIMIKFKELSINTKIPMSKLLDEALEDIIKKYEAPK